MSPDTKIALAKILFDDGCHGCHGCVNSWLVPNFGWIILLIIVSPIIVIGLFFALIDVLCFLLDKSLPPEKPELKNRFRRFGLIAGWKHGQRISSKSLEDIRNNKPGNSYYWDSNTEDCVEKKEQLTNFPIKINPKEDQ